MKFPTFEEPLAGTRERHRGHKSVTTSDEKTLAFQHGKGCSWGENSGEDQFKLAVCTQENKKAVRSKSGF